MTAQLEENIFIDGQYRPMATCPGFPVDGDRIIRDSESTFFKGNSACWRGYVASWEIRDHRLYLCNLQGQYVMRDSEPIHATWYIGKLRICVGDLLEYVHMGFGSVYEEELQLKVKRGMVVRSVTVSNRKGKSGRIAGWYRRWVVGSWWRSQG